MYLTTFLRSQNTMHLLNQYYRFTLGIEPSAEDWRTVYVTVCLRYAFERGIYVTRAEG